MDWTHASLKILNLSDSESAVLNTLNEAKTIQDIAQGSLVSRTGVKHIVKNLLERNLIKYRTQGKRIFYFAIPSDELFEKMRQTLDEFNLASGGKHGFRYKTSQSAFTVHSGLIEVTAAYKRIAADRKNERVHGVQHHRSWLELIEKITPRQLIEFNKNIVKNHIILDGLLNESAYKSYQEEIKKDPAKHADVVKSLGKRAADYGVFPDDFFNFDAEMWFFKDTALIINWKQEIALEITDKNMTGFLRDMLLYVKNGNKKIDHHKALREVLGSSGS